MRKKLLITGGSGLLGSNAAKITADDYDVYATYKSNKSDIKGCKFVLLDITDKQEVLSLFERIKPDVVIHAAGLVNVDYCEDHEEEAWAINADGTENVARASNDLGAKLIYISTDSVFDGKKGRYTEEDIPHPLTVYAKTKHEGEYRAQHWLPDSIIVRTAFYGWSIHSKKSLAEWVVNSLRNGEKLKMFTDVFFTPILVNNLVEVLIALYRNNLSGLYHVGGKERCSKYAFGHEIARAFGLNQNHIEPLSIADVGLRAQRPKDPSLDIAKVSRVVDTRLLGVEEGIAWFKDLEP